MTLEKALRGVVLAGAFALPFLALFVSTSLFFPFITGKNFAFRIIVEIMAGAWIALALANPAYRPRRSWLLWAFAAFVILIGISAAFGTYPFKSFWSNYERMEGWVTLAHLFAYFVVAVSVLNTEKLWRAWWHTSLAVSVVVAMIGVLQLAGQITINQGGVRLDARLGNATYAAVYMLFHIFIAALFLARAWVERGPGKRLAPTLLYSGIIALNSLILFFTATRGAILGLIGGAVLSALILIVLAPRSRVAWRAGAILAVFLVVGGAFWFVRDAAWVQRVEPLYRIATILDGTAQSRFMNWGIAWEGFKERPILGWGQENYAAVFDKYYDPNMYAQEQWFDRVHNILFDWLIAGGILGLLAYLSLYLFALLAIWRSGGFAPYERAILTGLLAGYFFYLLFTFDNITSYILFVSLLAYIAVRAQEAMPAPAKAPVTLLPRTSLPVVAVVAIVGSWGIAWFVNADAIAANRTLIKAISQQQAGPTQNLEYFKEALSYGQGRQEIREQLSQAAMSVAAAEGVPNELKQQFVELAAHELMRQAEESPHNARAPFFLGALLNRAGAFVEAREALDRAHALSPNKQGIIFEAGLNAFARGEDTEAVALFREAYELAPAYREARIFYASALIRTGNDMEADAILAPLMETGEAADPRVVAAYIMRGSYDKAAEMWSARVSARPQDVEARLLLADAYFSGGNSARAIETLEALKRDIPDAATHADALIEQIRSRAQ